MSLPLQSEPHPAGPPALPPGRRIELAGRGTTFIREVTGPPGAPTLLLLHGLAATAGLNWFTSFEALGRDFHVVAPDLRGHGRGIRVGSRFRLSDCADDVAALVDALGLHRVIVVGYSMGGPIAQLTWYRHPQRVGGLVLCATSRNFRGTPRERLIFGALPGLAAATRLTPVGLRRRAMQAAVSVRLGEVPLRDWAIAELRRNDPAAIAAAAAALGRFSSHEWAGDIDVPTAVVVTERDRVVPPHRQLKLARSIPGATTFSVDADHTACAVAPELFVPALVEACRSVARRATNLDSISFG
ncbi:MAG: alpha/beta fold hydrolase [Acidimicrobiales bacterium]